MGKGLVLTRRLSMIAVLALGTFLVLTPMQPVIADTFSFNHIHTSIHDHTSTHCHLRIFGSCIISHTHHDPHTHFDTHVHTIILTPPSDITVEATSSDGAIVQYVVAVTSTETITSGPTCTPASGSTFPLGTATVMCTASDAFGFTGTTSFTVTVQDTTPPTITGAPTTPANANGWYNTDVTVRFNCEDTGSGPVRSFFDVFVSAEGLNQSVTGTCTDNAGNSADLTVSGINIDKTPPSVVVSRSPDPNVNGWNNTPVEVKFEASDALSGIDGIPIEIVAMQLEGANQSVSHTFMDKAGNSATGSISGVNIDFTPPTLIAPASLTEECASPSGVTVTNLGTAVVSDNLTPVASIQITNDPPTSFLFPLGMTTITWKATDLADNSASATQSVTVRDTTPPTITAPPNIVAIANTRGGAIVDVGTASASDICDSSPRITGTRSDAKVLTDVYAVGTTTITWTATDDSGNSASASQLVTVKPLPVSIDIKPGSFPNSINPNDKGVIPVAILTTTTFDASTVDPLSVRFGPSMAAESHGEGHLEDVDGDGDMDMVLHFDTKMTGIACGQTSATLTGQTLAGIPIEGSDTIRTVGGSCK